MSAKSFELRVSKTASLHAAVTSMAMSSAFMRGEHSLWNTSADIEIQILQFKKHYFRVQADDDPDRRAAVL